jgi:hypothetical protein
MKFETSEMPATRLAFGWRGAFGRGASLQRDVACLRINQADPDSDNATPSMIHCN